MKKMVQETEYHYTIKGNGHPVVLLHGFTGTLQTWAHLEELLINQGYQVICIDLIGHGQTVTNSSQHTMKSICHDIKILLENHSINQCTMIGYSQGGRVALSFAVYFPELLNKLVLESASPGIHESAERKQRKANDDQLADRLISDGLEMFVNKWEKTPLFGTQRFLDAATRQNIRNERLSQTAEGLALALRTIGTGRQPSWWEELSKIRIPTLLIVGSEDIKFVKMNKKMNSLLPYSRIELVKNSGHAVHIEKPSSFNELVCQFLNE